MTQPVESPDGALLGQLDLEAVGDVAGEAALVCLQVASRRRASRWRRASPSPPIRRCCSPSCRRALPPAATTSTSCRSPFVPPAQGHAGLPGGAHPAVGGGRRGRRPRARARAAARRSTPRPRSTPARAACASPSPRAAARCRLDAPARPMGVEQSNSSIVFGDETVLKVFRRLEPGINPELEMLRFLTRRGFPHIAPLQGWYEYEGRSFAATLGVAQRFFAERRRGLGARAGADPHRSRRRS